MRAALLVLLIVVSAVGYLVFDHRSEASVDLHAGHDHPPIPAQSPFPEDLLPPEVVQQVSEEDRHVVIPDHPEEEADLWAEYGLAGEDELKAELERADLEVQQLNTLAMDSVASPHMQQVWGENVTERDIPEQLLALTEVIPGDVLYAKFTRRRENGNFDLSYALFYEQDYPELYAAVRRREFLRDRLRHVSIR